MHSLIKETLQFLQEEYGPNDFVMATPEEWEFFHAPAPEPPPKPPTYSMEELRTLVSKAAPHLALKKEIPDDAAAKKIASHWQEELNTAHIAILSFGEVGPSFEFLQNIATAITSHFSMAKVVDGLRFEKEKKWPLFLQSSSLKLILATPGWKTSGLLVSYRQNPTTSHHFLDKIPMIALESPSAYFKNPALKRLLWNTLVSHLSS